MQTREQKTMSAIKLDLTAIRNGLPFEVEQAWIFSESYIATYLTDHTPAYIKNDEESQLRDVVEACDDRSSEVPALLAAGRLEWLLRQTRPSLSYQGDLFFPDQLGRTASDLCAHLGVETHLSSGKPLAQLIEKLIDLTPSQQLTLADALEQAWHRGMKQENKSPKEFFATLGIDLT
jgi:hypothetical protein